MEVSGWNENYENETELFIGLVPISTTVQQYIHPLQRDLPRSPIPQGLPNPAPIQNTAVSVNNAGYPNANTGYPNINAGYSNTNSPNLTKNNPIEPMSKSNIGFVIPVTPPGVGVNAPYSMGPGNAQSSNVSYPNFASPSAPRN